LLKIIYFLIFTTLLNAIPTIVIDSNETNIKDFGVEYYLASSNELEVVDISHQNFTPQTNRLSLGTNSQFTWIRFDLFNSTGEKKNLFIHNELGYMANEVNFYAIKESLVLDSLEIDMVDTDNAIEKMYGTDAIFPLTLEANERKTIYIKNVMLAMQFPYFTIYDERHSKRELSKKNGFLLIFVGMFIALALYHLTLYFSTGYKEYLYYSLYLTSATIWEMQLSGMLANYFGFYFNPINEYTLLSVLLVPIFLVLFSKTIFNTKEDYKLENKYLDSVLIVFTIAIIIGLFNVPLSLQLASFFYLYLTVILFMTNLSIMKKGNPVASIFLVANSFFILLLLITDLYYKGILSYSDFIFNAASFGVLTEALILAFLMSYRIKTLQKNRQENIKHITSKTELEEHNKILKITVEKAVQESRKKDKILFQQSKMISMGEMIENIAHQWRQPLAEVNASVSVIDNVIYEKYDNDSTIEKELTNIENLTNYMSKTIYSFQNYFEKSQDKKEFSLRSTIYESILILGKSLQNNNVVINVEISEEFIHSGYENEFQQVILVLLNNAKEALLSNSIQNPKIEIKVYKHYQEYKVTICDNAGGIKNAVIEKIFDPYFTTKKSNEGTGLGLYIAKMIVEDKMGGRINVENIKYGSCFSITLKREKLRDEQ